MKTGAQLIAEERWNHVEKGWTPDHDDEHADAALAIRGAELAVDGTDAYVGQPDGHDPWGLVKKHRPDRVRQLTIAGALIAAEIDRLQREGEAR